MKCAVTWGAAGPGVVTWLFPPSTIPFFTPVARFEWLNCFVHAFINGCTCCGPNSLGTSLGATGGGRWRFHSVGKIAQTQMRERKEKSRTWKGSRDSFPFISCAFISSKEEEVGNFFQWAFLISETEEEDDEWQQDPEVGEPAPCLCRTCTTAPKWGKYCNLMWFSELPHFIRSPFSTLICKWWNYLACWYKLRFLLKKEGRRVQTVTIFPAILLRCLQASPDCHPVITCCVSRLLFKLGMEDLINSWNV